MVINGEDLEALTRRPERAASAQSTVDGETMAKMLATFAQFERRLISQRTKEALAVKKASGC